MSSRACRGRRLTAASVRNPRLFIGIALDDDLREWCAAVAAKLRVRLPKLRFVEPQNYHLTLAFLGNVDSAAVSAAELAVRNVARAHEPFTIVLNRLSAFPHERSARVIFVGCRDKQPSYGAITTAMAEQCDALELRVDKKDDVPHVTIARNAARVHSTLPLVEIQPRRAEIVALTLFESIPQQGKTRYEIRAQNALGLRVEPPSTSSG